MPVSKTVRCRFESYGDCQLWKIIQPGCWVGLLIQTLANAGTFRVRSLPPNKLSQGRGEVVPARLITFEIAWFESRLCNHFVLNRRSISTILNWEDIVTLAHLTKVYMTWLILILALMGYVIHWALKNLPETQGCNDFMCNQGRNCQGTCK